jgi:hypothetical protein
MVIKVDANNLIPLLLFFFNKSIVINIYIYICYMFFFFFFFFEVICYILIGLYI